MVELGEKRPIERTLEQHRLPRRRECRKQFGKQGFVDKFSIVES